MRRVGGAAYWLAPPLFCLAVYWFGLQSWFQQDDFAWLGLRLSIFNAGDLARALFLPMAQGTSRFLSERAFFLVFERVFGLNPWPFHLWVFLTQCANLFLLSWITTRLTGSRAAGFWAPMLWVAQSSLAIPMSWSSSYNEILFCFFLLLSFALFLRYIETGRIRFYILQWVTFLLGFGALELMVVYPALVALYTLCRARKYFRFTLPLFPASIGYAALHIWAAPMQTEGPYVLHFDWRLPFTWWTYWKWAVGAGRLPQFGFAHHWVGMAGTALLTLGLLGFAYRQIRRKEWLPIFFLGWYAFVLLPLTPLRDHISIYYLTAPTLGLAMLAGWALGSGRWAVGGGQNNAASSLPTAHRPLATLLVAVYLASSVPAARFDAWWNFARGRKVEKLVKGVLAAHRIHPSQSILLKGVSGELFWAGVYDSPFRLYGIKDVYLVPESATEIPPQPDARDTSLYILPWGPTIHALDRDEAVVYDIQGDRPKNITAIYLAAADAHRGEGGSSRVNLADAMFASQLGEGWYFPETSYRWMGKTAAIRLRVPSPGRKLYASGFVPAVLLAKGPLHLTVRAKGALVLNATLAKPDSAFEVSAALPSKLEKGDIEFSLEVDRVFTSPSEPRALGLPISTLEIR